VDEHQKNHKGETMPHAGEKTAGKNKAKKPKTFKCAWTKCTKKTHEENEEGTLEPKFKKYPNNGKTKKKGGEGGYRECWIAAGKQPFGDGTSALPKPYLVQRGRIIREENRKVYLTQGHHLVPSTILDEMGTLKKNIKTIGYQVDHNNNGLFLPEFDGDQPYHMLPRHSGNHCDEYYEPIQEKVNEIEKAVEKACTKDETGDLEPQKGLITMLDGLATKAKGKIMNITKKTGACWQLYGDSRANFHASVAEYDAKLKIFLKQ
jgi:hypothetical protein